ncbi:unnamed protein product [Didymodactylos carnosus]|uniref:Uncharacterized protein n=1 Tax=Didymodactylos carnosus TaxID=1234261 RepID=A0A815GT38_9BILA|nr:unnamed protein product [Didymodactylos carnosus]CAF4208717.1 unnamed protein product [Didymodactylos carnosus]
MEMIKLSSLIPTKRHITAICNIRDWQESQAKTILSPSLKDPYFQKPEPCHYNQVTTSKYFNQQQVKAIQIAVDMFDDVYERLHLIHGPPGTGKSKTIAGIVENLLPLLNENQKILLCAPSNNACNELLKKILEHIGDKNNSAGKVIRVGCQPPEDKHLCDYYLDYMVIEKLANKLINREKLHRSTIGKTIQHKLLRKAKVIISTLNYSASSRLRLLYENKTNVSFLIVDEACQASEVEVLIPFRYGCRKVLLVGDPHQLAPCVLSKMAKEYKLDQSLYCRLNKIFEQSSDLPKPITMLNVQYRMAAEIALFPNKCFYDNKLINSDGNSTHQYSLLKPLYYFDIQSTEHNYDCSKSAFNENEVDILANFCSKLISFLSLFNTSDPNFSVSIQQRIGIITPYKGQTNLLKQRFESKNMNYIDIGTVDCYQGKEKDIILISCVRTRNIGFFNNKNRLNVMLTRAKYVQYIFGHLTHLSQYPYWNEIYNDAIRRDLTKKIYSTKDTILKDSVEMLQTVIMK